MKTKLIYLAYLFCLILILSIDRAVAQSEQNESLIENEPVETRWGQLSFVPGLGTNGLQIGKVANKYSLNVIAGYNHSVSVLEIGGVLNMQKGIMHGVQLAGIGNIVGAEVNGVQIAGVSNINGESANGTAVAGVLNYTTENAQGVQVSGVSNINLKANKGLAIAGVMNYSSSMKGFQLSSTVNFVKAKMKGLQLSGGLNYADTLSGVQIGIINVSRHVEKGVMIGIFNYTKGGTRFSVEHNDVTEYNILVKSGLPAFYSIFSAGISPHKTQELWSYGLGFGSQVYQYKNFKLQLEATSNNIYSIDHNLKGLSLDNRFSPVISYRIANRFTVDAGPTLHLYLFSNDKSENIEFSESLGHKSIFSRSKQKMWIGYTCSVTF